MHITGCSDFKRSCTYLAHHEADSGHVMMITKYKVVEAGVSLKRVRGSTLGGVVLSFLKRSGKKEGSCCSLVRISTLLNSITLWSAANV